MPDTISPVTREEDYLAAIAGQDVTPPTPVTRKEEWLDLIAGKVDDLAGDIEDLQDVVPTPAAADEGKVLTAGADGTASWQTASGGGGIYHLGYNALDSMADAPDGSAAADQYEGYYSGVIQINSTDTVAYFFFPYPDCDQNSPVSVVDAVFQNGRSVEPCAVDVHSSGQTMLPVVDDGSSQYYYLTPTSSFSATRYVTPLLTHKNGYVLPADTPFQWVRCTPVTPN